MAAVWGAALPAEACPPRESSAGCRSLAETSGRRLVAGWTYPQMGDVWYRFCAAPLEKTANILEVLPDAAASR